MTSKIKVDNINKVSDDSNIIKKCGTTITLGASGDSIALASGASQTGFGRTGTVDWQTGDIKTATFTATNGEGYFCNTSGGAFTVNLPAGSAGAIVSVQDYNNTFDTNALKITPNGSEKINGGAAGQSTSIDTEGQGVTFVYIDATVGWRSVQSNEFAQIGESFMVATGGTITTQGNFKIHTFTGPGTFTVCSVAGTSANNEVSYVVVAGGGGGAWDRAGGGGAGGYRENKSSVDAYTASPLNGATPITVTATGFPIAVGSGGANGSLPSGAGVNGSVSSFSSITSAGGGGGGSAPGPVEGNNGGSGGGSSAPTSSAGTGNIPSVSPPQGQPGGIAPAPGGNDNGGGGGGATAAGTPGGCNTAGIGGAGATSCITGSPVARAGGGGGGAADGGGTTSGGAGGAGGGGAGGNFPGGLGTAGTTNTGGGGGGGSNIPNTSPAGDGGAGGSGIVIIRYKFQ